MKKLFGSHLPTILKNSKLSISELRERYNDDLKYLIEVYGSNVNNSKNLVKYYIELFV